jgi:ribosomal protein L11 methyltransferase
MPWLQLTLDAPRHEAQRLSDALEEAGALAVSLEAGDDEPIFETEWNATPPVWQQTRIVALFPEDTDIAQTMAMTATLLGLAEPPSYRTETIADQNWARVWMERWQPMHFGNNLWVVPSWLTPPDPKAVNLILDPGMAFGTGTHATTGMCLDWLAQHSPRGLDVIDFGCGSGILAIAALKLGARSALGTDTDPQALVTTRENAERNEVIDQLTLCLPEAVPAGMAADVVLANILAPALVALAPTLIALTKPGGWLILSGILASQTDEVAAAYAGHIDFERQQREDWAMLTGQRRATDPLATI